MARINLVRGGTPKIKYMWCEGDRSDYTPPYGVPHIKETPPYDSHVDGAYGSGLAYFTLGMPVRPNGGITDGMRWQRNALSEKVLAVDDVIDLIAVPQNHYLEYINFKIMESDALMAGASIALTLYELKYNEKGEATYTELPDIEDALVAQSVTTPIPIDKPCNVFASLIKTDTGYAVPVYANPTIPPADMSSQPTFGRDLIISAKIVALPTDNTVTLAHMQNAWYLSAKIAGFECPTYY